MTAGELGRWNPTVISGLLWGVIVGLLDTLGEPLEDLALADIVHFTVIVFLQWCITGLCWAMAARSAERRQKVVFGYMLSLPICCLITVFTTFIAQRILLGASSTGPSWLLINVRDPDVVVFLGWENAFYGGLYFLGYVATHRNSRLRQRMTEILRARGEADVLLREAQLRSYRGQLQPDLMLEALATLQRLSRNDPPSANRMFDRLVAFLRAAMPAVRTGRSTLADELTTLQAYGELRSMIPGSGPALEVSCVTEIADLPFPSLVLLPTLEAIAARLPAHGQLSLRAHSTSEESVLRLSATPSFDVPAQAANQLDASLQLEFGRGVTLITPGNGEALFEIRLPMPTPAVPAG